ncbi:MAG: phenol hydroxylase subunit [Azonexus sp.]|jgi:phenol hydroxylase P0 protein|nr:phenol hydroxylase subunit [Azonexus sp.]
MTPAAAAALPDETSLDTRRRFVRYRGERGNGFVEFEFAIGEPEIFLEMILSREDYAEFCAANQVEMLPPRPAAADDSDWDWRLADATGTRFR